MPLAPLFYGTHICIERIRGGIYSTAIEAAGGREGVSGMALLRDGEAMSLYIEVDDVAAVLLADGWHTVTNKSFELDAYEFHNGKVDLLCGGAVEGVCSRGAMWTEADGAIVCCPLTAVLAVRTKWPPTLKTKHNQTTHNQKENK